MKIVININEIEFEDHIESEGNRGGTPLSNIHNQMRIKKTLETELTSLLLNTGNDENTNALIEKIVNFNGSEFNNVKRMNSIEELEGGHLNLSTGDRNPSLTGKALAKSIFNGLNSINKI